MSLPNDIVLRPRFQLELSVPAPEVLGRLEDAGRSPFQIKRVDDHVFIRFDPSKSHFWSPQLQLEVLEESPSACRVIFGIWAYSSASLGRPYGALLAAMGSMVVLWFALYAIGRAGRAKGRPQMYELHTFFLGVVGG